MNNSLVALTLPKYLRLECSNMGAFFIYEDEGKNVRKRLSHRIPPDLKNNTPKRKNYAVSMLDPIAFLNAHSRDRKPQRTYSHDVFDLLQAVLTMDNPYALRECFLKTFTQNNFHVLDDCYEAQFTFGIKNPYCLNAMITFEFKMRRDKQENTPITCEPIGKALIHRSTAIPICADIAMGFNTQVLDELLLFIFYRYYSQYKTNMLVDPFQWFCSETTKIRPE